MALAREGKEGRKKGQGETQGVNIKVSGKKTEGAGLTGTIHSNWGLGE